MLKLQYLQMNCTDDLNFPMWEDRELDICGQTIYNKFNMVENSVSIDPILVIYSGHVRSFAETFKAHPQSLCKASSSFHTIMHTWDTLYPETVSWHKQNKNESHDYAKVLSTVTNKVDVNYLRIERQKLDKTHHVDTHTEGYTSLKSMSYGLRFFQYSRCLSIKMAIEYSEKMQLSHNTNCILIRPDIALRSEIDYKMLWDECKEFPTYFFKKVEINNQYHNKAVDCVIASKLEHLTSLGSIKSVTDILQQLKPSVQGEFGKYWVINRN